MSNVANNPVYQQLKISLSEAEANVASLQTRVSEYEARHERIKASMHIVPELEAEFAQLNRDYGIHKRNYESLVARRESAEITGQMEANAVTVDFRLIDPPRVTPKPVAPNRVGLFAMALLGALAAGVFASLAASQVRPSFFEARSLREISGLPLLGTVSLIVSESVRRKERRGLIGFIAGSVALLGSYGAGILVLFLLSARAV
jgi:polysaccharide chain length determinant protein (PEP-CTERM system associated)